MHDICGISQLLKVRSQTAVALENSFSTPIAAFEKSIPESVSNLQKYPAVIIVVLWSLFSLGIGYICEHVLQTLIRRQNSEKSQTELKIENGRKSNAFFLLDRIAFFMYCNPITLTVFCMIGLVLGWSRRLAFFSIMYALVFCMIILLVVPFIMRTLGHKAAPVYQCISKLSTTQERITSTVAKYDSFGFNVLGLMFSACMALAAFKLSPLRLESVQRDKVSKDIRDISEEGLDFVYQFLLSSGLFFIASIAGFVEVLIARVVFRSSRLMNAAMLVGAHEFGIVVTTFICFRNSFFPTYGNPWDTSLS